MHVRQVNLGTRLIDWYGDEASGFGNVRFLAWVTYWFDGSCMGDLMVRHVNLGIRLVAMGISLLGLGLLCWSYEVRSLIGNNNCKT